MAMSSSLLIKLISAFSAEPTAAIPFSNTGVGHLSLSVLVVKMPLKWHVYISYPESHLYLSKPKV